jgi:hypothetical protein
VICGHGHVPKGRLTVLSEVKERVRGEAAITLGQLACGYNNCSVYHMRSSHVESFRYCYNLESCVFGETKLLPVSVGW